jgi:hypothetical protein
MTRVSLLIVSYLLASASAAASPAVKIRHNEMAKCVAFYTWEAKTSEGQSATILQRAAARVRAKLTRELGSALGDAIADSAIHTWDYMSSAVSDAEWLRIKRVLHPACLEWE